MGNIKVGNVPAPSAPTAKEPQKQAGTGPATGPTSGATSGTASGAASGALGLGVDVGVLSDIAVGESYVPRAHEVRDGFVDEPKLQDETRPQKTPRESRETRKPAA